MPTALETYASFYLTASEPSVTAEKAKAAQQKSLNDPMQRRRSFGTVSAPVTYVGLEPVTVQLAADNLNAVEIVAEQTKLTKADKAIRQLLRLSEYDYDWDGNGAAKPIAPSVKCARDFIRALSPESIIPSATLLADGNAVLYIDRPDLYAELEFGADKTYSYFVRRGEKECFDEAVLDLHRLPNTLAEIGFALDA